MEIYNFILWLYWYNSISTLLVISPHRHANHACLQKRNQLSDGPILCYFVICKMLSWTKSMMFYLSSTAFYEFTIRFKNTALSRNTCTIRLYKRTLLFHYIRPVLHMQLWSVNEVRSNIIKWLHLFVKRRFLVSFSSIFKLGVYGTGDFKAN